MQSIRERVSALWTYQLEALVQQYEELEREGVLGDCELRSLANKVMSELPGNSTMVVPMMHSIVFEALRELVIRYRPSPAVG